MMAAYLDCEQSLSRSPRNDHTHKSVQKPDLPLSPSTSGSTCQEAPRNREHDIEQLLKTPPRDLDKPTAHQDPREGGLKRKGSHTGHGARKRRKATEVDTLTVACTGQSDAQEQDDRPSPTPEGNGIDAPRANGTTTDPIEYWAHNQRWPEDLAIMSQEQSASSRKRASSSSYTQRYKDGDVPEAYSAAYEKHLTEHGMIMEESAGRSRVSQESKLLGDQLLQGIHEEPQHTMFPISQFLPAWERAQNRNEARLFRDITPLLVPSPELLFVSGHSELQHLVEEISVEWTKCKTLGGPRPKPDFAVGLASSAFTEEEMAKLKNYASPERPTAFTENLYFPFVLCEAKCGDQGIRRADRQNMHSGSVAVNAIAMLGKTLGPENMSTLEGQMLVYSISHDNERVKLYGHLVHQGTFYRYPIASFVLNFEANHGWKRTHDFFREVYRLVYPTHLKRIRSALAAMADPRTPSITSSMSLESAEESEPQELNVSVHSSQANAGFKRPGTPASKRQKTEMALLREQLAEQQTQNREQMLVLERRMAEQADQYKEQADQYKEQIKLLHQLLERR